MFSLEYMTKNSAYRVRAAELHNSVPQDWYVRSIKENILQRFWHNTRFREVAKLIEPSGGKILDIGSNDGTFTKVILDKSRASKVIGIDVLSKSVSFAKRRFARSNKVSFRVADAHSLPFQSKEFDAVFCLETMEHVENPDMVILEARRVLKDTGYMVVLVPSENWLFRRIIWPLWTKWRGKIWKHTHLHQFKSDQLVLYLKKNGFAVWGNHKFLLGMLQAVKVKKTQNK